MFNYTFIRLTQILWNLVSLMPCTVSTPHMYKFNKMCLTKCMSHIGGYIRITTLYCCDHIIDLLNLQDSTRRLHCAELGSEVGCYGNVKLMYYVNYAAQNNDLGLYLEVLEVNNYDGANYKPEKNIWMLYGSSWDHIIIKQRDKNADKISKNMYRKILMIWSDRTIIRRNRSENRKFLARIDNLQITINYDVKSRVCAGPSARINVFGDVKYDEVVS